MWILVLNGLAYLAYGIASGRFRRKLLPIWPARVIADVRDALRFKLAHDDSRATTRCRSCSTSASSW